MSALDYAAGETLAAGPATRTAEAFARRTADLTVASVLLVLLAPVLALIALAIRLETPGAAIFRQERLGKGLKAFTVLKFRSMRTGADESRHERYVTSLIAAGDRVADHGQNGLYKLSGDDRVTRVGAFIRRTSLDELPQLWNVVRGDMSLVGPRPVLAYEVGAYPSWYFDRFSVKPGMTGLWQVSGRNERTYEEMVRLDCEYAERQSLRLDVTILARTVVCVLLKKGAA